MKKQTDPGGKIIYHPNSELHFLKYRNDGFVGLLPRYLFEVGIDDPSVAM